MSELTKRILFALPAAVFFLWIAWIGERPFEMLVGMIAAFTLWEVHRIMKGAGKPGFFLLSVLVGLSVWLSFHLWDWFIITIAVLYLITTVWAIFDRNSAISDRWLSTLFTGMYAPIGFLMLVQVRGLGENIEGFWLTLTLLLMIWGNDVFAYFGGKNFGKRPLAPVISPQKTWEGFWFGFLGAAAGFMIVYWVADPFPLPVLAVIGSVIIVSVFGPLGDVTASSLKRKASMKDSSSVLPGHGGFFDRFDSLILSAPLIFFYFHYMM